MPSVEPPDPDEYRRASLEQWENSATAWSRRREQLQRWAGPVSQWLVEAISPQPGQIVLELAAGAGETGFLIAELLEPGGRLISSDFAEPMVEAARERGDELGLRNVEYRVLNGESLDLEAANVDAVVSRWGYMLMADPAAALRETRRVLRPGGRVALAVWDAPDANPWVALIGAAVREVLDVPAPDPDAPGMFALAPPGRLEAMLGDAGFAEPAVEALDFEISYDSFEDWWETQLDLGRPMAQLVATLDDSQGERVRAKLRDMSARFAGTNGELAFPARSLMAVATA